MTTASGYHVSFRGRPRGDRVVRAPQRVPLDSIPTPTGLSVRWPDHVTQDELGRRNAATCQACRSLLTLGCCDGLACQRIPGVTPDQTRARLHLAILTGDCPRQKLEVRND